jgi:hypothetical protein
MRYVQDYAEVFASRLNADVVSLQGRPRRRGERSAVPADELSAGNESKLMSDDRAFDQKRIIGGVLFYGALLLISGLVAVAIDAGLLLTGLATPAARSSAAVQRAN